VAVDTFGVVQIGGAITTIADIEEFLRVARSFGATDTTEVANGFLAIEFAGIPVPTQDGDEIKAVLSLTVEPDYQEQA
jgi:hypothetical protein